jgi:hypothetical protein
VSSRPHASSRSRLLAAGLALAAALNVGLALWPRSRAPDAAGGTRAHGELSDPAVSGALFPALAALWRDVRTHDSEALRREYDGWYARLLPVYAAIEAQVPPRAALLLSTQAVPPWFVVARFPERSFYDDDPALPEERLAELRARHGAVYALALANGEPLLWSLQAVEPGAR